MPKEDSAGMQDLLEICCLWVHIRADMASYFGKGPELEKIHEMFVNGFLVWLKMF